jgi:MoaA/NifB/PqqE/SkfB family radical SAM enzyme
MIVIWQVTERCNLACPFCAFDRNLPGSRREADPGKVHAFGHYLAEYQRETAQDVLVSWLGGEPLLWKPLQEISTHYFRDLGLRLATTTNGTTLGSATVRRHLLGNYSELTVSVDALDHEHDRLRGATGLYASLARNVRTLSDEIRSAGSPLRLRANVVLMRQTVSSFERLCDELAEWGITEISFNQLGGNDRPEFYPDHRLRSADVMAFEEAFVGWRERLARGGVRLLGSTAYIRRMNASSCNERVPVHDCQPGCNFLFIDVQGRIAPCSFTGGKLGVPVDEINSAGDLRDLRLRFASSIAKDRPRACDDCLSTRVFEKFAVQTL